jgi:RNA polymerase sigma-70 factor, ECF subfamily
MAKSPERQPSVSRASDVPESNKPQPPRAEKDWLDQALPKVLVFARSLLRQCDFAEDIVHDCVCRLLAKGEAYDMPRDGVKLLFRAVTNACINAIKRQRGVIRLHAPDESGSAAENQLADHREQDPIDQMMTDELRAAIDQAIEALPDPQRAAIQLKSLGHSLTEIGESLGVTANHAGVLVHRARQALRQSLANHLQERA